MSLGPFGYNLFLLKTENWKHYSKIIFKSVNSAVEPIFNEKVAEKWNLWVLWIVHGTHGCDEKGLKSQNIYSYRSWKVAWTVKFVP